MSPQSLSAGCCRGARPLSCTPSSFPGTLSFRASTALGTPSGLRGSLRSRFSRQAKGLERSSRFHVPVAAFKGTVVPDSDPRMPLILFGSAGTLLAADNKLAAAPVGLLGSLLLFQASSRSVLDAAKRLADTGRCAAVSAVLAACIALQSPFAAAAAPPAAAAPNAAIADVAVLIKGQPVKDANSLLRYALPISNQPIKDVQLALELITEDLRIPGLKALDGVERNVRQASRVLSQNKGRILEDVADANKAAARDLVEKLEDGLQEFQRIIGRKERALVPTQQKALLAFVGDIEEAMVTGFPFEIPEELKDRPWLRGRATLDMVVNLVNNPNLREVVFQVTVDGYNAPISAGNFVDLVQRGFYNGMEIQRADGFVVQTGDPDGPEEGFVDPKTGELRRIPLEVFVDGDKAPIYHETTEELGRYKALMRLPFNAFGTMAMAREEFDNDSASSQVFWLLKESELTPSSANILDGRYAVFGYITENADLLADLKVGDKIKSITVMTGLDNLVNPTT